jgi:catechol 2,3-dioxygenase-like lactoylglutathione lyase family enzyme
MAAIDESVVWVKDDLMMLGHLSFGVSDLNRSKSFYDAALTPLGLTRVWTKGDAAGYGPRRRGSDLLALKKRSQPQPPGPGLHLAFNAPSRAAVDAFHAAALKAGGIDNGAPGLRPQYGAKLLRGFRDRS